MKIVASLAWAAACPNAFKNRKKNRPRPQVKFDNLVIAIIPFG
jgi:hypothetical protein